MTPPRIEPRGSALEQVRAALEAIADEQRTSIRRKSLTKPHVRDVAADALAAIAAASTLDVEPLLEPGRLRSAAIAQAAASLRRDIGVCGDRCRAAATHALDAALQAAKENHA